MLEVYAACCTVRVQFDGNKAIPIHDKHCLEPDAFGVQLIITQAVADLYGTPVLGIS